MAAVARAGLAMAAAAALCDVDRPRRPQTRLRTVHFLSALVNERLAGAVCRAGLEEQED